VNYPNSVLEKRIGYQFVDPEWLTLALTHRSLGGKNNERLEFLGDSILGVVIAEYLFARFPDAREGQMSRLRARLVKGVTLAELGREFDLGHYLRLGSGEMKSGGYRRDSILADAVEAIIGAIFQDGGINICKERILDWYGTRLEQLGLQDTEKDPKTRLQEYLQSRQEALPVYEVISIKGEAHKQQFCVVCDLGDLQEKTMATGSSRRMAEQNSAQLALVALGLENKKTLK